MTPTMLLVPLDGSSTAEAALPYAEAFARAIGASLRLLSVTETGPESDLARSAEVRAYMAMTAREEREDYLHRHARALQDRGVMTEVVSLAGEPDELIVAAADQPEVRAIVMATHGRGGLQRWYLGSVADKVMRGARRPVLMAPAQEGGAALPPVTLRTLLVPLDGSDTAEGALSVAAELAAATGAGILLARVQPWLTTTTMAYPYVPELGEIEGRLEEAAAAYLDRARTRLPSTVAIECIVLRGAPATELLSLAQTRSADLVVMTTHGRGGIKRLMMGSTADRLVRAGLPVLLLRPNGRPAAVETRADAAPQGTPAGS